MAWNALSAFVLNQLFGYQTANKMRENLIALASIGFPFQMGGSRFVGEGLTSAVTGPIPNYIDMVLDGTNLSGLTVVTYVDLRTADAATTVTPTVYNLTDLGPVNVGTAHSTTSWAMQEITWTPANIPAAIKTYRLLLTPSNGDNEVFGVAWTKIYATA